MIPLWKFPIKLPDPFVEVSYKATWSLGGSLLLSYVELPVELCEVQKLEMQAAATQPG